jgi:hypothetical protein
LLREIEDQQTDGSKDGKRHQKQMRTDVVGCGRGCHRGEDLPPVASLCVVHGERQQKKEPNRLRRSRISILRESPFGGEGRQPPL